MAITIACIQSKGGVGKTTSVVNLGHALAMRKQKVLIVDLDSQGSASLSLGVTRNSLTPSIANVLLEGFEIEKAVRETSVENMYLVTGSMELANFDVILSQEEGRTERIKEGILPILKKFEVVILDCPPTMSLLPVNALVACNYYLIPVTPHYLAVEGLVNLLEAIERIKAGIGTQGALLGFCLTMVGGRARMTKEMSSLIRKQFGNEVFKTEIRVNTKLAEAPSFGRTIFQYDWNCPGARAYQALAKEVIHRTRIDNEQAKGRKKPR